MPKKKTNIKYIDDALELTSQVNNKQSRNIPYRSANFDMSGIFDREKVYNRVFGDNFYIYDKNDNTTLQYASNLVPGSYGFVTRALAQYFGNKDDAVIRRLDKIKQSDASKVNIRNILAHEDLKDMYLNMPQRTGLIHKSEYKPTKNDGHYHDYYTSETLRDDYSLENIKLAYDDMKYNGKTKGVYIHPLLAHFTSSIGVDPKRGEYVSIYDKWDFNQKGFGDPKDNIASYIQGAAPVELYDRFYMDDWYGVNSAPNKGDYYGGYLPEIVVKPKQKR